MRLAHWVVRSLAQRADSVCQLAHLLLTENIPLCEGKAPRPTTVDAMQVAERLGLHVSTVRKLAAGKSVGCQGRSFPLEDFLLPPSEQELQETAGSRV